MCSGADVRVTLFCSQMTQPGRVVTRELHDHVGKLQQRRGEDHGDHARHVDLQRNVGRRPAQHPASDHALGVLHRDAALRLLDVHDGRDDREDHQQDHDGVAHAVRAVPDRGDRTRERRRHRREDQQRHAVADAALGDALTHPHDENGAGGHGQHHGGDDVPRLVGHDRHVTAGEERAVAGQRHVRGRLQGSEADRDVPGVLRQLGLAVGAFLLERLEARDEHAQQLHHDRRGDVRHDAERKDRQLEQRAAGEEIEDLQRTTVGSIVRAMHCCTLP